jgi:hypothetical protein
MEGDHRRVVAFYHNKMQPVDQAEFGDFFLKLGKILRWKA